MPLMANGSFVLMQMKHSPKGHIEKLPRIIESAQNANGIRFRFDMWNETDTEMMKLWTAHKRPWVLFCEYRMPINNMNGMKQLYIVGGFPINAADKFEAVTEPLHIQHWGWSRSEDRQAKYDRYMQADPDGKFGILAQYKAYLTKILI